MFNLMRYLLIYLFEEDSETVYNLTRGTMYYVRIEIEIHLVK